MKRFLAVLLTLCAALIAPAAADPARTANVEAELHSSRAAIAPGERFTIVLRQRINPGWHTYWRNPGDSGEPAELTWTTPAGFQAGPIQWPTPEAIPFATLVNFGYSGEVFYPIEITAPANARVGEQAVFTAAAYWLVCSDICIPEETTLQLAVPIAAQGRDDPTWAPRVADAVRALPKREQGFDAVIVGGSPAQLYVALPLPGATEFRNLRFFPFDRDVMEAAAPQRPRVGPAGARFDLAPGVVDNLGDVALDGVVALEARIDGAWRRFGFEISAQPGAAPQGMDVAAAGYSDDYAMADIDSPDSARAPAPAMSPVALLAALGLAFLGGLILNVMPCVLPVLSIKALSFAGGAQAGQARTHGLFYFAGVMATFLTLAVLLIALRGAGEAVGWGFQLQAPWVTSALALLFFVIGLNLLGVFDIGGALQNAGGGLAGRGGSLGAFFTGALAVVAATPCAAPFMATAVGAALLSQSGGETLLILGAMGIGFALPLTVLHFAPALQKLIPSPGPWMERARNVLAFPMFAASAWLAWVLAEQMGPLGVAGLISLAIAIAFAVFVARWGRLWLVLGALAIALTAAATWRPLIGLETRAVLASEPWSPARVLELRGEGRGVFVNFTAAWCVTCKVNEGAALANPRVAQAFADHNVAYLKADWTNRDDAIAAALAEHGRAGVPLYLYYPPGGDAQVLPQILTEALVLETIAGGAE